jgi:hypothetical protein
MDAEFWVIFLTLQAAYWIGFFMGRQRAHPPTKEPTE